MRQIGDGVFASLEFVDCKWSFVDVCDRLKLTVGSEQSSRRVCLCIMNERLNHECTVQILYFNISCFPVNSLHILTVTVTVIHKEQCYDYIFYCCF